MDRYADTPNADADSPPPQAWLFALAILGRPIPRGERPEAKARARRAELNRLARFSAPHAQELRDLHASEGEARRNRELLEWTARISGEAHERLRAIEQLEGQARRAWRAANRFDTADWLFEVWNEADHPRAPKGTPIGGQWIEKGGGGGGISTGRGRSPSSNGPTSSGNDEPDERKQHMLDLAYAWWQTKGALDQARRDIEKLPTRIDRYQTQRNSRFGYLYKRNLAQAREKLKTARSLIPQLEAQLRDLTQEYHDAGYDDIGYSTFTPAEKTVGGKGIEEVGHAVARGGTPRGLQSTGIEFEIASALLAGPAVLRLGKSLLGKAALGKAATQRALGKQAAKLPAGQRATLGSSTSKNYRKTFFAAHPDRQGKVVIHHGVEQQVLDLYPGVVTESELHSLENLRGIPKGTNSDTHLREIRKEWNAFYDQHPRTTKEQLLDKATEIDDKYGHLFDPPIR